MRLLQMPSPLLSVLAAAIIARPVIAGWIPHILHGPEDLQNLRKRCDNPCGYYGQVCCQSNEYCYTNDQNQAACGLISQTQAAVAAPASTAQQGNWYYTTTTFVQTDLRTVTMTLSSFVPTTTLSCQYAMGQSPCDSRCCDAGQYCKSSGVCMPVGGGSSGYYSNLYTVTTYVTNTASIPLRPTSNTLVTVTATGTATTTVPYQPPVATDGSSIIGASASTSRGGLSGGAIAGIVIGVIAAIIILLIICACCCAKGILDSILAIFGLGPRRKRTEEVEVYESHHHSGSRPQRTWYGATRPARPARSNASEKKTSGWGRGASVAAFLGGLALLLGLKRSRDRKDDKSSSGYGSSYYSDYTSSSESSSDRRTRRSSRSRSRASRVSRR